MAYIKERGNNNYFVRVKELGNKCLILHNKANNPILLRSTDSVYCCGRVLGVVEE